MKQVKFTLPENAGKMLIKLTANQIDLLLSLRFTTLFHKLVNVVACLMSISPLLKTQ